MTLSKAEQRIKEELTLIDVETAYREVLADLYGMIDVCGYQMSAGAVLYEMDNTAFRCGCNDWIDSQVSDNAWYELDGEYYNSDEAQSIIDEEGE